jgi:ATP phosphoribosyltransferase regulatory subunit
VRISAALPTGVTALLFEAARRRREIEAALAGRLLGAGFGEVILPVLDYLEPYEPLLTPAGRAELYRFVDRDGEMLALRADFTPMLARLLAPRLGSLPLPLRLFYRGDVVRFEEERAGREREFYQMGAELLGVAGPEAEREMLALFLDLLAGALPEPGGLPSSPPVQVVLGFAGALDGLLLAASPSDPAGLAAAVARRERAAVRAAPRALLEVVEEGLPRDPAALGEAAAPQLVRLLALRDELAAGHPGIQLAVDLAEFARQTLDPRLAGSAGGLRATGERPYYDGLVFRAHAGPAGHAVGGGGRYDRLFQSLGAEVPAVGFSLGLDRLALIPEQRRPARDEAQDTAGAAIHVAARAEVEA